MGLKKRNKVNAQFNMSSLTDIIFLLLIFFMLTSTLVAPNALNLKLPGSSRTTVSSTSEMDDVRISQTGNYFLNGRRIDASELEQQLRRAASGSNGQLNITISPDRGAQVQHVVTVMDIAMRLNINGILATEE